MKRFVYLVSLLVFSALLLTSVCFSQVAQTSSAFQEWEVLDVERGQSVSFAEWILLLAQQDVVYLGEEHRNHWHIDAAVKILTALVELNRHPQLGMEMFGWDSQPVLNQHIAGFAIEREQFLKVSHWQQNWGGTFEDYAPLVSFARLNRLPLFALNPPRPLVRKVAIQGLKQAMEDPDMATWGMTNRQINADERYREIILRQLQLCHGGLSENAYEKMYEASMFRDEGMAKVIKEALHEIAKDSSRSRPFISYTGGGHIQYGLPVPNRVLHHLNSNVKQKTIYMTSFVPDQPQEVENLLHDHIADYIWLTPVGDNGPPKRCR